MKIHRRYISSFYHCIIKVVTLKNSSFLPLDILAQRKLGSRRIEIPPLSMTWGSGKG